MQNNDVKFSFSEKTTKIYAIILMVLTFTKGVKYDEHPKMKRDTLDSDSVKVTAFSLASLFIVVQCGFKEMSKPCPNGSELNSNWIRKVDNRR